LLLLLLLLLLGASSAYPADATRGVLSKMASLDGRRPNPRNGDGVAEEVTETNEN